DSGEVTGRPRKRQTDRRVNRVQKSPAFQFYPGDWMRDLALRSCSISARGLWIDLLCLMWDGSPRGYLRVADRPIDAVGIAKLTATPQRTVRALLNELEAAGV